MKWWFVRQSFLSRYTCGFIQSVIFGLVEWRWLAMIKFLLCCCCACVYYWDIIESYACLVQAVNAKTELQQKKVSFKSNSSCKITYLPCTISKVSFQVDYQFFVAPTDSLITFPDKERRDTKLCTMCTTGNYIFCLAWT